jgi:hypothetical protein
MSKIEIPEPALSMPLRPNWPKRILLAGLILVPLCLAMPIVYFVRSSDRALREGLAEADKLDPGWRLQDLEARRAVIPDEHNSALVLMSAQRLLPANLPFWDHPQAPENRSHLKDEFELTEQIMRGPGPPLLLNERQTKALREELRRAEQALATLRKVISMPEGRFASQNNGIATFTLGRLLAYDVLLRAQDKDMDTALQSCRGILNCGRSMGDEPGFTSMLARIALNWMAIIGVERTLGLGEPSEPALSSIQHDIEIQAEQPLLLIAARGERAYLDAVMHAAQDGDLDPVKWRLLAPGQSDPFLQLFRFPGMAESIRSAVLRSNNEFVEIAKLPVEQQSGHIEVLHVAEQNLPQLARNLLLNTRAGQAAAFHRDRADLRCAVVILAVERYRRANKQWPDTLADLIPTYLARIPLDPFDGAPLRYRRWNDGVVVYSIGPGGHDHRSKLGMNPSEEGTDRGFRLLEVAKRRQQPKPPKQLDGAVGHERD